MFKTYLNSKFHITAIFLIIFFFLIGTGMASFLLALIYLFFLWLFRKSKVEYQEYSTIKEGIIYSPCNGKIMSINKKKNHFLFGDDLIEIRIAILWGKGMGIHLPTSCEVIDISVDESASLFRLAKVKSLENNPLWKSGISVLLNSSIAGSIGLQLTKCTVGLAPEIALLPGDRGKGQVSFGHFPFGGTLLLYLPSKYEILIAENQDTIAAQTIIAGLPEIEMNEEFK